MKRASILAAVSAMAVLGLVPAAQAELRVSKNYRLVSDPATFRFKDMPAIAVNPNNPNHVVEVNSDNLSQDCEGTRSLDGGTTWSRADAFALPPTIPGSGGWGQSCRITGHAAEAMYQTVAFGSGQNVYATYVTPRLAAGGAEESQAVVVVRSADGGLTWDNAFVALQPGPGTTGPDYELPAIAVRPGATQAQDRIVVAARERGTAGLGIAGDAAVAISNNGGQTWTNAVAVEEAAENVSETSQPVIGPDGSIAVAYRVSGQSALIRIARWNPATQLWGAPVTVAGVFNNSATSNNVFPTPNAPGHFIPGPNAPNFSSSSSFPRLAVDQTNGNLYIVYNQSATNCTGCPQAPNVQYQGADHFIPPDSDVFFQRSLTNGATWSAPELVNEADPKPGNESPASPQSYGRVTQTRHPNVYVAPNGRVDVVWHDRRHWYRGCIHTHLRCEEARLGDTYYAFSNNARTGAAADIAFSKNRRISDRSQNNDVGTDYRYGAHWAFGPVAAYQGNNLLVAWFDSREGNFDNDNLDIYLAKVNHNGPSTVPQEGIARTDLPTTSVRLSRHAYPGGGEGLLAAGFATRNGTRAVIVNENNYPAMLAGSVLARAHLSQLFVSSANGLNPGVAGEIARIRPAGAVLVGDNAQLGGQVVTDVGAAFPAGVGANDITRLPGTSAPDIAARIARHLDRRNALQQQENTPAFNAVIIANPNSPDAAAAAGLAAARRLPFLFVNQNSVPQETQSVLTDLDIDKALVVGGTQWVSNTVQGQLPNAERLGGANQYETSRAVVAESIERGLPDNIAYVADGSRPADGALLGSAVGRVNGLQILAPSPLSTGANSQAAATGITGRLDRMILLQPAQGGGGAGRNYPLPPDGGAAAFADCPTATANVIRGNAGSNSIVGTPRADRIFAGTGNDTVDGLAANDCIDLGPGTDRGQGGDGHDLIVGGLGRDRMSGNLGNDRLRGGSSGDRLIGGFGNDRLHGQSGSDRINGERGRDRINGGSSNDVISAGSSNDRVAGDQGNDRINGNSGNDSLLGNSGRDRISGSTGRDRISGGSGNDRINARDGQRDRINCGTGRDSVRADSIDRVSRNCERVSRRTAGRSSLKSSGLAGVPALLGAAYLGLVGLRRRRG